MYILQKKIIDGVISREQGYVNNPDDSGGETRWGITRVVARQFGYNGHMRDLPREIAFEIYVKRYWTAVDASALCSLSEKIGEEIVDTGVNSGIGTASKFLQRCLNVLNLKATLYPDLTVDGNIGGITISALAAFLTVRGDEGEVVLYNMLNSLQGAYLVELAERREKDESFIYGWFRHRVTSLLNN